MALRPKLPPKAPVTGGDAQADQPVDAGTGLNADSTPKATKGAPPVPPGTAGPYGDDLTAPGVGLTGDILPPGGTGNANTYDPKNPAAFINYNMQAKFGRDATPDEIAYWTGKLNSQAETGTIDPATGKYKIADPAYWATRIRKEGVDDVNPQAAKGRGYLDAANQFGG